MSKIHFLPVKNGDSFVIECDKGSQHGVVVVDGGPTGYGNVLQSKVKETGIPDLLVLTHYDEDHIGGLTQYINACMEEGVFPAKEVWANCAGYVEVEDVMTKSIGQGVKLSELLSRLSKTGEMLWRDDVEEGIDKDYPFASIEVVSPTPEVRGMVIEKQEEEGLKKQMRAKKIEIDELTVPLEELAKGTVKAPNLKKSNELANAASIAFILRCDGLSILMLGDGYPHNVEAYLRNVKGYSEENPLEVDFVKVSHHGSMNNTSNELLDIIKCNHFIIPTNGEKHHHPDRTAIAHILCHPKRDREEKVHLYFNCGLDELVGNAGAFINDGEQETWNFEMHEKATELFTQTPGPEPQPEPEPDPEEITKSLPLQPPVAPAPAKQPLWKRPLFWVGIALALAAVLAVCLG
ncbi:MAG: MBL fold metallo-hydrolase [Bacteroidales bacterium]|nr:MBL fold metallo-hydrolase [Bacteroidales bacterium]